MNIVAIGDQEMTIEETDDDVRLKDFSPAVLIDIYALGLYESEQRERQRRNPEPSWQNAHPATRNTFRVMAMKLIHEHASQIETIIDQWDET